VFCIYLKANSDLCHLQHKLIGFYNRDEKCLQRGRNWVFKLSSLRFVFKGLKWIGFTSVPPFLQYAYIMYYSVFKCEKGEWIWRRKISAFAELWMRYPLLWYMTLLGWVFGSCLCKTTWLPQNAAYPTHKWLSVILQNNVKVKVTPWYSHASTEEKQIYSFNPLLTFKNRESYI